MPAVKNCPEVGAYEQLLLGKLSVEEGERLGRHLEECTHCVEVVQGLKTDDTLAEALRRTPPAGDSAEQKSIAGLIERLKLSGRATAPPTSSGKRCSSATSRPSSRMPPRRT